MLKSTTNNTDEDGWQVISTTDWWRTPFEVVSWAYQPSRSRRIRCTALCRPALKPFHSVDQADGNSEQELNIDLVGVTAACGVLRAYEADSGFYHKFGLDLQENECAEIVPNISRQIDQKDVVACKENWNEIVQNLTGDFTEDKDTSSSSGSDASSLASSLTLDSSDWECPNYVSLPSTPKPYAPVSYGTNWSSPSISPSSKLNASASTFTPSGLSVSSHTRSNKASPLTLISRSSPSPTLNDFIFPSLNSPSMYPKHKIEKDDQGFYTNIEAETEVAAPKSSLKVSTLLPAFLPDDLNRRKGSSSKTRALVDRLRSRQSLVHEGYGYNPSSRAVDPRLCDSRMATSAGDRPSVSRPRSASRTRHCAQTNSSNNNDGWIGLEEPQRSSLKSRKRHGFNLSLSTTSMHHRAESGPAILESEPEPRSPNSPSSQEAVLSSSSTSSSSSSLSSSMPPTPPIVTNNDGWIEVPDLSRKYNFKKFSTTPSAASHGKTFPEEFTFPTLNAPPPSSRRSRSHARSSSSTSSLSKLSTKASKPSPACISPPAPPSYYVPFPPALPVTVPYAPPYALNPVMTYATITPQYHPHQYPYQRQYASPQQYAYHQRAHSVTLTSNPTMPAGYVKPSYVVSHPSPMAMRSGMW